MKKKWLALTLISLLLLGSVAIAETPVWWQSVAPPLRLLGATDSATSGAPLLKIGGWVLIGAGALMGAGGLLLLAEGFTSTDRNTADFGKMMGTGMLVMGGASAGLGVVFLTVRVEPSPIR